MVIDEARGAFDLPGIGDGLVARIARSPSEARNAWYAVCAQGASQHTQTYEWYDAYGRTLGASNTDWVIVILLNGNQPAGVLPLRRETATVFRMPVRALSIPGDPDLMLCDVTLPRAQRTGEINRAIRDALARAGIAWDVILLRGVPANSQAAAHFSYDMATVAQKSSWFSCGEGYQAIAANFSTRLKKSLKKAQKGLFAGSSIEIILGVTGPAIHEAFADFLRVEASGWKAECGSAIALSRDCRSFYELLAHSHNPLWRAEINLLKLGGQTIAAQFCIRAGRRLTVLKIGYDQAHCALSPGNLLLNHLLKASCESGELDTVGLVTHMDWMRDWGPRHTDLLDLIRFNRTPAGLAARALGQVKRAQSLILETWARRGNHTTS